MPDANARSAGASAPSGFQTAWGHTPTVKKRRSVRPAGLHYQRHERRRRRQIPESPVGPQRRQPDAEFSPGTKTAANAFQSAKRRKIEPWTIWQERFPHF